MAISTSAAAVGGLILVGVAFWQFNGANDAQREVANLKRQLMSHQVADIEMAKHVCADRSQRYFTTLGYDESKLSDDTSTTFQNHYNVRLRRCLMTIESTSYKPPKPVTTKTLIDTDERKVFGNYAWVASTTKKYWDQPPIQCVLSPPDRPESTCHSTDEYDAFVTDLLSS